jgi:hypothetical protein
MRRAVERNFDGMQGSIKAFLVILNGFVRNDLLIEQLDKQIDTLRLIKDNIADKNSRCLLQIVKG